MRVIKYRAWDKTGKQMREVLELQWYQKPLPELGYARFVPLETTPAESSSEFELMQFTGLKDKNGKEIYEGDILRIGLEIVEVCWGEFDNGKGFEDQDDGYGVYFKDEDGEPNGYWMFEQEDTEVIGNIYENKDLLK